MRVRVAEKAGFCFGVKRAYNIAEEASGKGKHYTLGSLVHNRQVKERLKEKGILQVEKVGEISSGSIIIRAHGVPKRVVEEAIRKGHKVVDATCPYVKRGEARAILLDKEGFKLVIFGEKDHPEVKGIAGNIENYEVIGSVAEARDIRGDKIGLVSQTTQNRKLFFEVEKILGGKCKEFKSFDTICAATTERQEETRQLARETDAMIIIGDKTSGNTRRLFEISKENNGRTYWIETAEDLEESWFSGIREVGISAGASTPDFTIQEVAKRASEYGTKV